MSTATIDRDALDGFEEHVEAALAALAKWPGPERARVGEWLPDALAISKLIAEGNPERRLVELLRSHVQGAVEVVGSLLIGQEVDPSQAGRVLVELSQAARCAWLLPSSGREGATG